MPRPFAITAASNSVFLDEDRKGEARFTVSNQSGRSIEGRARLVAEEAESWVSLRGEAHRTFAIAGTEQYTVEIEVPPDAPSGSYALRLDMVGEERPDEQYAEGPTVAFEVPEPEAEPEPFPWKIVAAIAAMLLIGGGLLAYQLIPNTQNMAEAKQEAEKITTQWMEAMQAGEITTVVELSSLPFFWDNEVLTSETEVRSEARAIAPIPEEVTVDSLMSLSIAEYKERVDPTEDRLLSEIQLSDDDLVVFLFVDGEAVGFFFRRLSESVEMVGFWG